METKTDSTQPDSNNQAGSWFWRIVKWLVLLQAAVAGLAILAMIAITCASAIRDLWGRTIFGASDVVCMLSAVSIACALPYTTAVKGHVAIEFFFHKLSKSNRIVIDSILRVFAMALFGMLCYRSFTYGLHLNRINQMAMSVDIPIFWVPIVISVSCGFTVLVILYNLLHPGREMIKP